MFSLVVILLLLGTAIAPGAAPVNDNFASRTTLFSSFLTNSISTGNIGATKEPPNEPNHAGNAGGHSVWWTWTAPVNSTVTLDTIGSSFDTLLAVYTGNSLSSLANVASDDDGGANKTSLLTFVAVAGTTYQIAVDGWGGATGNISFHLYVPATPPQIAFQPQSFAALPGSNVNLSVTASGSTPLSYRWRRNGSIISGATDSSYSLANAQGANSGTYTVVVTNAAGTITSAEAILVVQSVPPNDNFANRITVTGQTNTVFGANLNATAESGEPTHNNGLASKSVWWTWTAVTNGLVYVDINRSFYGASAAIYTGTTLQNLSLVASGNNSYGNGGVIQFLAVAGMPYQIAADSLSGESGFIALNLHTISPPQNDAFANRTQVTGISVRAGGSNVGATKEPNEPNHAGQTGGASVWWTWTAPTTGTVFVDSYGSSFATVLGIYTGNSISNLVPVGASADGNRQPIALAATAGTSYQIAVDANYAASGSIVLNVRPPAPNDAFATRQQLAGLTNIVTAYNLGATREPGEPSHAGSVVGKSVWWEWTAPADLAMQVYVSGSLSTAGNSFYPVVAIYTGNSVSQLISVSSFSYPSTYGFSFLAVAGTTYQIAVDGSRDPLGPVPESGTFVLDLESVPPPSNDLLQNATVIVGSNFTEYGATDVNAGREPGEPNHGGVSGGHSIWWVWLATTNAMTTISTPPSYFATFDKVVAVYTGNSVSNLTLVAQAINQVIFPSSTGMMYRIAVDGWGSQSGQFSFELRAVPPPSNDAFANRISIGGMTNTSTGNNSAASFESGEPFHANHSGGKSVWWSWTAPTNRTAIVDTMGSSFKTALAIYTGTSLSNLILVESGTGGESNRIAFAAIAGTSYQIAVDSWGSDSGDIILNIREVPSPTNDLFANRIVINGASSPVIGSNLYATREASESDHAGEAGGKSVWWTWTAPTNATVTLDTIGSTFDTLLAVYTGNSISNLVPVAENDQGGHGDTSELAFSAAAGTTYQIVVDGYEGDFGDIVLNFHTGQQAPLNDKFANRVHFQGFTNTVIGSNLNATKEIGEPEISQPLELGGWEISSGQSVWWTWNAPADGFATLNTAGSSFNPLVGVYTGNSVSNLTWESGTIPGAWNQPSFSATAGTQYQIKVAGYGGESGNIVLSLNLEPYGVVLGPSPSNDSFVSSIPILGPTNTVFGSSLYATSESGEPAHAGVQGGSSVWWSWTTPTNCVAVVNTLGTTFYTLLGVYTGTSVSNLVSLGAATQGASVAFSAKAGTEYKIAVDGANGVSGPIVLNLYSGTASLNDQFTNRFPIMGTNAFVTGSTVFATTEAGEPNPWGLQERGDSLWWTWTAPESGTALLDTAGSFYSGVILAAYTGNLITNLTSVAVTQEDQLQFPVLRGTNYLFELADFYTGPNSWGNIVLSLQFVPLVSNDTFSARTAIVGTNATLVGSNFGATAEAGEAAHAGMSPAKSVWWTWTAPINCTATLVISNNLWNTVLAVYTGNSLSNLTQISGLVGQNTLKFQAVSGTAYQIVVDSPSGPGGTFALDLRAGNPPPNDAFENRIALAGASCFTTGSNNFTTSQPGEPNHAGVSAEHSVWWTWTAPSNGVIQVDTVGSSFATVLAIYTGNSLSNLLLVATDGRTGGDGFSKLTFLATSGVTYQIAVDSYQDPNLRPQSLERLEGRVALQLRYSAAATSLPPISATFKGNWPGFRSGQAIDVQVVGSLAYVSLDSGGLLVLDVSDTSKPAKVGSLGLNGNGPLVVTNGYAYFGGQGLVVVDISNPAQPIEVGNYSGLILNRIAVEGEMAYAIGHTNGDSYNYRFFAFDISDKLNPRCISTSSLGSFKSPMLVQNGVAFIYAAGILTIEDLNIPQSPVELATLLVNIGARFSSEVADLALQGSYLYISYNDRLAVVDVRDCSHPRLVGGLPHMSYGGEGVPTCIGVSGTNLYVGAGTMLSVIDISNPTAPRARAPFFPQLGHPWLYSFMSGIRGFWAIRPVGNLVYVALAYDGLQILDISNPDNPSTENIFYTYANAQQVAFANNYLYLLNPPLGLQVLDIATPESPRLLGTYPLPIAPAIQSQQPQDPVSFVVRGSYAYILEYSNGVSIVDFKIPSAPKLVKQLLTNEIAGTSGGGINATISFDTTNAYIWTTAEYPSGEFSYTVNRLYVFDVSRAGDPVELWSCSRDRFPGLANDVVSAFWTRNGLMYLLDAGLKIYDVGNAGNPTLLAYRPFASESPSRIVTTSDRAFASAGFGVNMYDINNPYSPTALGSIEPGGGPGFDLSGRYLAVVGGSLDLFDLNDQLNPVLVGSYAGNSFVDVALAGSLAAVAAGRQGVTLLSLGTTLNLAPSVALQPASQRVLPGSNARLDAGATGTMPLKYQWWFNGNPISGATDPFLVLNDVKSNNFGLYSIVISNSVGAIRSSNATLSVDVAPAVAITTPSSNQAFRVPATIVLAASAADSDGSVAKVSFYNDLGLIGSISNAPFTMTWSNVALGTYTFTAVATDNEGASTTSSPVTVIVTNVPVFQFSQASYVVNESNGAVVVSVQRNTTGAATVGLKTVDGTAKGVANGRIGSFIPITNILSFPPDMLVSNVTISLVNDLVFRGNRDFGVNLYNAESGWSLVNPTNTTITIVDDDSPDTTNSLTDIQIAPPPPTHQGALTVTLQPTNASGQWRFPWETVWRLSGNTASNLPPASYSIVFHDRAGWTTPDSVTYLVGGSTNQSVTNLYSLVEELSAGAIRIDIAPSTITNSAQWRPAVKPPGPWLNSGTILGNLAPGELVVEFSDVNGYTTPDSRVVQVASDLTLSYPPAIYNPAPPAAGGESPRPFANLDAIVVTNGPYQFSGQLLTDIGYSSGFVVKDRVVLTAAHAIFDPTTLSYVTNTWWFFQREAGEYEPAPQIPRGSCVFEGYASARISDVLNPLIGPDDSSTPTRQQDVAALYFLESAGRGGYGGYLASGSSGTDWLLSGSLMTLLGYPVETVPYADRGRMHQIGFGYYLFNRIPGTSLYSTHGFQGYPGNSGGPLCVQGANNFFYPAAIYLGGTGESIVRSIDLDVVDLINRADTASHGGGDSSGGPVKIGYGTGSGLAQYMYIEVTILPQDAANHNGGWHLQGASSAFHHNGDNYSPFVTSSDNPTIVFDNTIDGWNAPATTTIPVVLGATAIIKATYVRPSQLKVTPAGPFAISGRQHGPFGPPALSCTVSNTGQEPLTWAATQTANWLTLSATNGTLAGGAAGSNTGGLAVAISATINANANSLPIGVYTNILVFTNKSNAKGTSTNFAALTITAANNPVRFTGARMLTNGVISLTLQGNPGQTYSILTSSNLTGSITSWTQILSFTAGASQTSITITNPPPTNATRHYFRASELAP